MCIRDRSKNAAYIPPAFGSPTSYTLNAGELLTPNLVSGSATGTEMCIRDRGLPIKEQTCREQLSNLQTQLETAKAEVQKPFPREAELNTNCLLYTSGGEPRRHSRGTGGAGTVCGLGRTGGLL